MLQNGFRHCNFLRQKWCFSLNFYTLPIFVIDVVVVVIIIVIVIAIVLVLINQPPHV